MKGFHTAEELGLKEGERDVIRLDNQFSMKELLDLLQALNKRMAERRTYIHFLEGNKPATSQDISDLEAKIKTKLDPEHVEVLKVYNGNIRLWGYELLSVQEIGENWERLIGMVSSEEHQALDSKVHADKGVENVWFSAGWIPFGGSGTGDYLCVDVKPASGGKEGQLVQFSHANGSRPVKASSIRGYLLRIMVALGDEVGVRIVYPRSFTMESVQLDTLPVNSDPLYQSDLSNAPGAVKIGWDTSAGEAAKLNGDLSMDGQKEIIVNPEVMNPAKFRRPDTALFSAALEDDELDTVLNTGDDPNSEEMNHPSHRFHETPAAGQDLGHALSALEDEDFEVPVELSQEQVERVEEAAAALESACRFYDSIGPIGFAMEDNGENVKKGVMQTIKNLINKILDAIHAALHAGVKWAKGLLEGPRKRTFSQDFWRNYKHSQDARHSETSLWKLVSHSVATDGLDKQFASKAPEWSWCILNGNAKYRKSLIEIIQHFNKDHAALADVATKLSSEITKHVTQAEEGKQLKSNEIEASGHALMEIVRPLIENNAKETALVSAFRTASMDEANGDKLNADVTHYFHNLELPSEFSDVETLVQEFARELDLVEDIIKRAHQRINAAIDRNLEVIGKNEDPVAVHNALKACAPALEVLSRIIYGRSHAMHQVNQQVEKWVKTYIFVTHYALTGLEVYRKDNQTDRHRVVPADLDRTEKELQRTLKELSTPK